MRSIIVGTAGHIDHGKSTLVQALTGKDPDRLPEEKRRGITIDLGFADLQLDEVRLGFVDVPGHERFIKNMLAGAHGIDLVALVIAADEGVMPQTREHFDICRLLGIQKGLVVITKTDLVEDELTELVKEEARELVAGSFLEGAPIVKASAKNGTGLGELKRILQQLALEVPPRSLDLVPMLPVDRAFTMRGFGPVVTGTLISGEIAEGMELDLLPAGSKVRARGVQVHGKSVPKAFAGQRTAINLGSVDAMAIQRGMVLAPAGRLQPIQILDVRLEVLASSPRPLRSRTRVRFHLHTIEVLGRVRVIEDGGEIPPGKSGFAQLRLESPVVAHVDERFILRSYSPSVTIAGGRIVNPFATKHRARDLATARQTLSALQDADRVSQFLIFVRESREVGQTSAAIAARTGWRDQVIADAAGKAQASGQVINCQGIFVAREDFDRLARMVLEEITAHHKKEPLVKGLPRETLRERLFAHSPPEVFRAVINHLEAEGKLAAEKEILRSVNHKLELSSADAELRTRLAQIFSEAGLEPPTQTAAIQMVGKSDTQRARRILQMMLEAGTVVRVQPEMIFDRAVLDGLVAKLRIFAEKGPDRSIDIGSFKNLAGVSRKYAIPLLEYFDRERITARQGDRRIINKLQNH